MKNLLTCFGFIVMFSFNAIAQEYKTHKVKQGESIESISKLYQVTPFDIIALNPDAKTNLAPDIILIIPNTKKLDTPIEVEQKKLLNYKKHKVRRKETLYSISEKYNIEIEDIKKHNKHLYAEVLRKGDRIQIPVYEIVKITSKLENTLRTYKVQKSEGKWRVAYKFGISVIELEKLNPNLGEELQLGQEVIVPNIANNEELEADENYGYYTVQPKEGFLSIFRKTGLKQEELEALNEGLSESGLKIGMILRVPKETLIADFNGDFETADLISKIKNYDTKKLAVMLPFRLHKIDMDSDDNVKKMLKKDGGPLNISLDFHSGVLMALDSAKQLGISTKLDVYDTYPKRGGVKRIVEDNDFSDYDAVIGPLVPDNFEIVASKLESDNVPLISTVKKLKNDNHNNVFQSQPQEALLLNAIVNHIDSITSIKNIIIISDSINKPKSNALKSRFSKAKQVFSRKNKKGKDGFIVRSDIEDYFKPGLNIVFLETTDQGFAGSTASMLNSFIDKEAEVEVILMTTNKTNAFEGDRIHNDLAKLKFHYPSVNKPYDPDVKNRFVTDYIRKYGTTPNRYAVRGFDITMDIILRLAYTDETLFEATESSMETEYIENKFRYSKKHFGGYFNEAVYIVRYDGLRIVEIKE